MGMPVRIEEDLYISARDQAKAEHRTISGQIEFWAKVGRVAIYSPDLLPSFIADSLTSPLEPRPVKLPKYKLEELLANWNPEMKRSKEDEEWLEMRPAGKEIW